MGAIPAVLGNIIKRRGFVRAQGGQAQYDLMRDSATELEAPRFAARTEKRAHKNVKIGLLF